MSRASLFTVTPYPSAEAKFQAAMANILRDVPLLTTIPEEENEDEDAGGDKERGANHSAQECFKGDDATAGTEGEDGLKGE